jgi:outer membrane protein assembly factor BamE
MEQTAVKAPVYESSSGMIFDRNLRYIPDEPEPEVKAVEATPRVGNKEIPNPKALPPESEPSFFDRMLEKIGF